MKDTSHPNISNMTNRSSPHVTTPYTEFAISAPQSGFEANQNTNTATQSHGRLIKKSITALEQDLTNITNKIKLVKGTL